MKRFKNILMVCDDQGLHDAMIGRAIWLAKANEARITLVDVVDAAPGDLTRKFAALPGARSYDFEYEVLELHRARLAEVGGAFRAEKIETTELVLQGTPFIEIIKQVLRAGHDLVIKGVDQPADTNSLFFSSTHLHLLRKCPSPVWIIKKSRRRQYARVLAAVDPDPADPGRNALNRLIMDLATSLSATDGSELHVLNAWGFEEETTLRHSAFIKIPDEDLDALIEEERKRSAERLSQLMENYPADESASGPARQIHLVKGNAPQVIPEFARKRRVELIVMGTVARTGISGLFIGNTAESILNQIECSILAVKPPGFETPVKP